MPPPLPPTMVQRIPPSMAAVLMVAAVTAVLTIEAASTAAVRMVVALAAASALLAVCVLFVAVSNQRWLAVAAVSWQAQTPTAASPANHHDGAIAANIRNRRLRPRAARAI